MTAEIEESRKQAKEEIASVRKDLKDQIAYAKAVEAEKKQLVSQIEELKSSSKEIK